MQTDPRNQSPFNTLPPVVTALAVVIVGIELLFFAGTAGFVGGRDAVGWRLNAIRDWAVIDPVWSWMWANMAFPPGEAARWLAYPLIHNGFTHAALVAVFVLALGNAVAPVYRGWRVGLLFFGPALAGGLAYVIVWNADAPLFGGYPGAYGLIGAFTYLTQRGLTRADPSRAFLLIGLLLAIQPVFGLLTGAGFSWLPLWTADLAGAAAGYALAGAMFPGAMARLRDRLRHR
ncbi:rhomboid family intramembrane serine protease [Jannaschia ovalis]|uniref:Rhomboid family intramembrane serine protease n=1 Tax=Jannaschia ovalis TaxID=3038773 RepID=A0ABY8LFF1_9RHOB|nr:rhomboid family intramembrane serine protease [Jannaschia sp. GRR-S6-38]WGH80034.1 rhomboid family intramembrane serine protease [Jannaschia sp. GRR-S6-38]